MTGGIHALGPAEARAHGVLGLGDDFLTLCGVGEAGQHGLTATLERPAGNEQRSQARLPGQVGVDVGRGVGTAFGGLAHHGQQRRDRALLAALRFHVRDHRHQPGTRRHRQCLGHADLRTEARLGRQAIVVGEERPPGPRHVDDPGHLFSLRIVRRLVVEAGRHAVGPGFQSLLEQVAHAEGVVGRGPAVGRAHHLRPHGVEANRRGHIQRQRRLAQRAVLADKVDFAAAIGIDELGRHALRQHVHRRPESGHAGVRVDVDEAGRHKQPACLDDPGRRLSAQVAHLTNDAAHHPDIGPHAGSPGAVDHRAAPDDEVKSRCRGLLGPDHACRSGHQCEEHAAPQVHRLQGRE